MMKRVGSSGQPDRRVSFGPFWTILQADLGGLFRSRITYGWVLAAVFIQAVRTLSSSGAGTMSAVVSSGLSDFVYLWALVIIGLSASSVSSESGELADSVMSKSVTRLDYVLAKFASRICYTLVTFSLVAAVLVGLALKLEVSDYGAFGLASAVILVALALVTLTVLGVGFSVAMQNSVVAIVSLLVLWYAMTVLFPAVGLGFMSPGSLLGTLPGVVRGTWSLTEWESVAGLVAVATASTALSSAYFYLKDI
jgi:ABC-2 type transport system permease protein